ncbi:hypothetical protein P7K49_027749, partial [Saguinus oedipus]
VSDGKTGDSPSEDSCCTLVTMAGLALLQHPILAVSSMALAYALYSTGFTFSVSAITVTTARNKSGDCTHHNRESELCPENEGFYGFHHV